VFAKKLLTLPKNSYEAALKIYYYVTGLNLFNGDNAL
jgi:hypothetical protein